MFTFILFSFAIVTDMTPLDYLQSCTSVIGSCQVIYSRVFEKYTNPDARTIEENV